MPTGYTADIYDGKDVSVSDFILTCSRAFIGAMRDMPLDVKPEESHVHEPSEWHRDGLRKAQARLLELSSMTIPEAEAAARKEWEEATKRWEQENERNAALRARYESMLNKIRAWTPPTDRHQELKNFMIEQLESSIKFDAREWPTPVLQTGSEYLSDSLNSEQRSIAYHTEQIVAERNRYEENLAWIRQLRNSLPEGE